MRCVEKYTGDTVRRQARTARTWHMRATPRRRESRWRTAHGRASGMDSCVPHQLRDDSLRPARARDVPATAKKQTAPAVSRRGRANCDTGLFCSRVSVGARTLDQFHISHRCRIAGTLTTLEDTQIATFAFAIARSKLDKKLADCNLVT